MSLADFTSRSIENHIRRIQSANEKRRSFDAVRRSAPSSPKKDIPSQSDAGRGHTKDLLGKSESIAKSEQLQEQADLAHKGNTSQGSYEQSFTPTSQTSRAFRQDDATFLRDQMHKDIIDDCVDQLKKNPELMEKIKRFREENNELPMLNIFLDKLELNICMASEDKLLTLKENKDFNQKVEFDVFIAHNSIDKEEVTTIAKMLKRRRFSAWMDHWELCPGTYWKETLWESVKKSKSMAVFLGSHGLGPWQEKEIELFLQDDPQRKKRLIPVLLQSFPEKSLVPENLSERMWVDFRKGKHKAILQLIWGITGKRLDFSESVSSSNETSILPSRHKPTRTRRRTEIA